VALSQGLGKKMLLFDILVKFFLIVYFLAGLSFELRALDLQSRHSAARAIPLVHFALIILKIGVS
jgi:hypothetical protein